MVGREGENCGVRVPPQLGHHIVHTFTSSDDGGSDNVSLVQIHNTTCDRCICFCYGPCCFEVYVDFLILDRWVSF